MDESSKLLLAVTIPTAAALIGMVVNYRKVREIEQRIMGVGEQRNRKLA